MNAKAKPDPDQPERTGLPPHEQTQEREETMRRSPLRDRLLQLFYWLYPYTANKERDRNRDR